MVAPTWTTPGCVQFLESRKRFHTAWVKFGLGRAQLRGPLYLDEPTSFTPPASGIAFPSQRATKAALDNDSRSIDFFQREFQVFFIFDAPKSWKN
jgi:hypothetical protein